METCGRVKGGLFGGLKNCQYEESCGDGNLNIIWMN